MPPQQVNNYSDIIKRIEQNLNGAAASIQVSASKEIAEASGESDEKDPAAAARSANKYENEVSANEA